MLWQIFGYICDDRIELFSGTQITLSITNRKPMGTGWLLNREGEPWQIGSYQSEEVRGKPSKVRTDEQLMRRPYAVILVEP
jgi:hypothetical protein